MKASYIILGSCLVATLVFAAPAKDKVVSPTVKEKEKPTGQIASKAKKTKDMTVQELADSIAEVLDDSDEVMSYVPGFKQEKGPDGKEYYTYKGVKLEKVEKEKLAAMYSRVRRERTRLNTERINRQLETIRQAQQAANIANQASRAAAVTMPPAQPPRPPAMPPQTVQPPRPPPTPPPTQRR